MSKSLDLLVKNIERIAAGRTTKLVFGDVDMPLSSISRIINKQVSPSLETLDKIAKSLKMPAHELIMNDEKRSIPNDILNMLDGQDQQVYSAVRELLKIISNKKQNKKEEVG